MKENEDDLKTIFDGFKPGLSPEFDFMKRLERNIDAVESIKQHNTALHRLNRRAAAVAALAGFVVGTLFSLAMPWLLRCLDSMDMPSVKLLYAPIEDYANLIAWLVIGAVSVLTATNAYELALRLLPARARQ